LNQRSRYTPPSAVAADPAVAASALNRAATPGAGTAAGSATARARMARHKAMPPTRSLEQQQVHRHEHAGCGHNPVQASPDHRGCKNRKVQLSVSAADLPPFERPRARKCGKRTLVKDAFVARLLRKEPALDPGDTSEIGAGANDEQRRRHHALRAEHCDHRHMQLLASRRTFWGGQGRRTVSHLW
jgi:hypothetical protein